jgi:hypothetical protein
VHEKLRYVCLPPGTAGWLNVALENDLAGVWQDEHEVP